MSSGKSGKPLTDFGGLYLPSERIPAAKPIVEDSSESLWAEFNKVSAQQEGKFAPTEVVSLEETARMELAQPAARRAQAPIEIGDVLIEARRGNRVCPKSPQWQQLHELLQQLGQGAPGLTPPTATSAWAITSAMAKRACFREQLEWADRVGCLPQAYAFIKALPQAHWHFVGD